MSSLFHFPERQAVSLYSGIDLVAFNNLIFLLGTNPQELRFMSIDSELFKRIWPAIVSVFLVIQRQAALIILSIDCCGWLALEISAKRLIEIRFQNDSEVTSAHIFL